MGRWVLALLLIATLAAAGSADDPEIEDARGDQELASAGFGSIDLVAAWVDTETAKAFVVAVDVAGAFGPEAPQVDTFIVRAKVAANAITATLRVTDEVEASGDAAAARLQDGLLLVTIPKDAFGKVAPGQSLVDIYVESRATDQLTSQVLSRDRAPDTGFGRSYLIGSEAESGVDFDGDGIDDRDELQGPTDPTRADSDGDGLDDGAEGAHGTDPLQPDSDDDGLEDGEELELGTDPLQADSDGDGVADGDEVAAGTDPLAKPTLEPEAVVAPEPKGVSPWLWLALIILAVASIGATLWWLLARRRGPVMEAGEEILSPVPELPEVSIEEGDWQPSKAQRRRAHKTRGGTTIDVDERTARQLRRR